MQNHQLLDARELIFQYPYIAEEWSNINSLTRDMELDGIVTSIKLNSICITAKTNWIAILDYIPDRNFQIEYYGIPLFKDNWARKDGSFLINPKQRGLVLTRGTALVALRS
jgi:hypothetical protein